MSNANAKKARRRERSEAERTAARELDAAAAKAVDEAIALAPAVAGTDGKPGQEQAIGVAVTTVDSARFVLKRINEALSTHEFQDEVRAWVWTEDEQLDEPRTENGQTTGIELRLTPR